MTRSLILVAVVLVALSVPADPYTFHLNGSDAVFPAPRWQTALALVDVALLVAGAVLVLRHRVRSALLILGGELLYALMFNAILIDRDGVTRFIWGFGAERHFVFFAVAFGLRVLTLIVLLLSVTRAQARAA